MNRTVFRKPGTRRSMTMMWLAMAVVVVAAAGLAWQLARKGPAAVTVDKAAPNPALVNSADASTLRTGAEVRAADAYAAQLDALRRQAALAGRRDAATAYEESLEALAQAGRQAALENRLPPTANAYAVYLDDLRRMAFAVTSGEELPADANEFSQWLDRLRRTSE